MNSHSSQSTTIKGKLLRFNAFHRPDSDDEQTLVSADEKNITPENSTNDVNKPPEPQQEREQERKRHEKRVSSRFQDALSEYVTYRHSLSGRADEPGSKNILASCASVSHPFQAGNQVDIHSSDNARNSHDDHQRTDEESMYVVRILKSYSERERNEDIVDNCCHDINQLQIVNRSVGSESGDNNSIEVDSSSAVIRSAHNPKENIPCEQDTPPPQVVTAENVEPVHASCKKQKRSVKKLFRFSKKSGRGSKRKRTSATNGVRFEILRETAVEGETENPIDGQGKTKRKRRAAKRMAKTAGKRLWKGFRVGCKFLWEGLIIYTKPFGTMDFTRAWDEKNAYNNNNNNNRTYTNYNAAGVRESVI